MEFNRVNKKYSNYQSGKWVWPLQIRNLLLSSIWCLRYASWRKWIFLRRAAVSAKSAVSATFRLNWVGSAGRCRCFAARAHMIPSSIVVFKTSSPKAVLTHLHQAASTQRLRECFGKWNFFWTFYTACQTLNSGKRACRFHNSTNNERPERK